VKKQLSVILVLSAVIISATAGCGAAATTTTAFLPFATAAVTTQSTPATTLPAPATTTPVAITSVPVTTAVFSLPPLVPTDPAIYATIVSGVTTVILADGHFAPPIIKIPVGTTVEWQATDHLSDHAIYGDDGKFWGGVIAWIPLDKTFTTPGTFSYHDVESMGGNGTVIVF
jgi:plastocyanin